MTNFPALVRECMHSPGAIFIRGDDGRVLTYKDYWALSGRLANTLSAHGVGVGDRVAVQVAKSIEALGLFLACARLGAVFLPLNTAYTPIEIAYFAGDAEPSLLICEPEKSRVLSTLCKTVLTLDDRGGGTLLQKKTSQLGLAMVRRLLKLLLPAAVDV